jgi:arabinose-5-phosphate isomerase
LGQAKSAQAAGISAELSPDLAHGQRVLALESDALKALAAALDERFTKAVALLHKVEEGRVVVSGMGKSGHVARKIAATLASTGTPAQFVHPAEASHGDMGAITAKDAVLVLSNSGETRELGDLIAHARRYRIPLVGIAGQAASTLIQTADVGLVLPPVAEACPMGLAPTTSTTMMLALGDALAVALMERRGFTIEQYRVLHPGGELGRALIRVEDIMHVGAELPLVKRTTPMREVLIEMTGKRFGCAGVVDRDGRLIGIITDGDLRRHMDNGMLSLIAEAVMTAKPLTIRKSALAAEALGIMNTRTSPVTCLFVVGDEAHDASEAPQPIGIVHMHDCLRAGVG